MVLCCVLALDLQIPNPNCAHVYHPTFFLLRLSGYIYPALLTALVPVRSYILSRLFSEDDLQYLDPSGETEEELREETRKKHLQRNDSFDSADTPPHFGQFHPEAMKKQLRQRRPVQEIDDIRSVPPAVP